MDANLVEDLRVRIQRWAVYKFRVGEDTAQDLAQDVLVVILSRYAEKSDPTELLKIAFEVLRRLTLKYMHKSGRQSLGAEDLKFLDEAPGPEEQAAQTEILQKVRGAIPSLTQKERSLLRLDLEGRSAREAAELLGVEENYLYTIRRRYREKLKKLIH